MTWQYEKRANKGRKKMLFESGKLQPIRQVFGYIYEKSVFRRSASASCNHEEMDRFGCLRRLMITRTRSSFQARWTVSNVSPFFNSTESRTTHFQEGEDDEDITPMATTLPTDGNTSSVMQENTYQGPITKSHVKQIQNMVNANLSLLSYYIDMAVLPISSTLIIL